MTGFPPPVGANLSEWLAHRDRELAQQERSRCIGAVELLETACRQDVRDATPSMRAHEEGRHAGIRQVLQILRRT